MWKSVLAGIILENIETLRHYQAMKDKNGKTVEDIRQFVSNVITELPWYFHLPVRFFAYIIGLLCLIATGNKLDVLSSEKRSSFLRHVQFIPFFGMLSKLVRSMAFLKLFDTLPLSSDY
jgi:hypothetical protein